MHGAWQDDSCKKQLVGDQPSSIVPKSIEPLGCQKTLLVLSLLLLEMSDALPHKSGIVEHLHCLTAVWSLKKGGEESRAGEGRKEVQSPPNEKGDPH